MDYLLHVITVFAIYTILAVALDVVVGHLGLLAMCQASFYGVGAYATALVTTQGDTSFLVALAIGVGLSMSLSLLISLPSLRLHGDFFAIATFAFQILFFSICNNWMEVTRGPLGIPNIPRPEIFGLVFESQLQFACLVSTIAVFSCLLVWRMTTSPYGRVLRAIREDEIFTQSLGKDTLRFKITAFALCAALASVAGSLYAHYVTYLDSSAVTIMESILMISMVIIGGAGSRWGPILGTLVLVLLPELLRLIGLPPGLSGSVRQMLYGLLLVVVMMTRPQGILGAYSFGR